MTRFVDSPARRTLSRALRKVLPSYRASAVGVPASAPAAPSGPDLGVTDGGERVVREENNFCYFAHLSIYNFAKPYAYGRHVLDAGCGTGYGSHYLFENGARTVLGIDLSEKAIRHCRREFARDGLRYEVMDLQDVKLPNRAGFGLIYSSNVLEHVADPDAFLARATRLLAPDGVFVLAVPAINSLDALMGNWENPYHINNITPLAWLAKMRRFFGKAQGFRHWLEPEWVDKNGDQVWNDAIRENNFTFTERSDEAMMSELRTVGTVIVARHPRKVVPPITPIETCYPPEWGVAWTGTGKRPARFGRPDGVLGPICGGRPIVQTFLGIQDEAESLEILMATYARENPSMLEIALREGSDEGPILLQRQIPAADLRDNSWMKLEFPKISGLKGRPLALVLSAPDAVPETAVTAYYTSIDVLGCLALRVGRLERPGNSLHFKLG